MELSVGKTGTFEESFLSVSGHKESIFNRKTGSCFVYPIENKALIEKYRNKIKNIPFLNALMKLSNSGEYVPTYELKKVVETMKNVTLPSDFWDEFRSEVGDTNDIHKNHELLEKLT